MLELLLGRSGSGKTEYALRAAAERSALRDQVILVPEQHSHDCERLLCALGGDSVSLHAEVLSFTRLSNRVFSCCGGLAEPVLDAGGRMLLMYLAVRSVSEQLTVLRRCSNRSAYLTGLLAAVDECKSCCITPAQLLDAARELGEEGDKLHDLGLICTAYDALTAHTAADPRDRITRLAEALRECRWAAGRDIVLDGFTDFTAQELLVFEQLLLQANSVTVLLTCTGETGTDTDGVFADAARTARVLERLARKCSCPVHVTVRDLPDGVRSDCLARVEALLAGVPQEPVPGVPDGVTLYRAASPRTELEYIASEILRLVRTEGLRYRDIAVASRSLGESGELLDAVFSRYGIPVFRSAMTDILERPVFALLSSALDTVQGGYRYDDVFRCLKTGLTDLSQEECDLLENYVLRWSIRGSMWTRGDWAMHPQGYARKWTDADRELLDTLNAARRRFVDAIELLRAPSGSTGRDWCLAVWSYLEKIDLPGRLAERTGELRRCGELTRAAEYDQLWDILVSALEQCERILGDTTVDGAEFARLFPLVLSQYSVGAIPVSLDRVTAAELPRLAHRHCKALFLFGADDTAIPQVAPSPGILNDDDRSLLASLGLETAPRLEEKLVREDTIVYEACALPSRFLTVSCSAVGSGGAEHRPARFTERLRTLFPDLPLLREEDLDESFRLCAPRPALELAGRRPGVGASLSALPEYAPLLARMNSAAAQRRGSLTRPVVEELYNHRLGMSATRIDSFQSCRFSYFLQYGLDARVRERGSFLSPDYGTFVHFVLEHVLATRGSWEGDVPSRELVDGIIEDYVNQEMAGFEQATPRFRYLFRRLAKSVYSVVCNVCEELAASDFSPLSFELGFGAGKELPAVEFPGSGMTVSVTGFVDRVDGWEKDGRLYLRVVDYKTGRKSFNLTDVWNGMGLQMLLYLFTLQREGGALYGKEIVPAGVLYLPAREKTVSGTRATTDEEIRRATDRELCRRGIVLDDPAVIAAMEHAEDGFRFLPLKIKDGAPVGPALVSAERLGRLDTHIRRVLRQIGEELTAGSITANPFWKGDKENACLWCRYAEACHFEDGRGDDRRHYIPAVKNEEFWERLGCGGASGEGEEGRTHGI